MDSPRYKIGTVAKLTGLSPFLLRAWESRYDLLRPHRTETGHRFYTQEDVDRLVAVKRLVDEGYAIGEVAAWSPEQIASATCATAAPAARPVETTPLRAIGREALFAAARDRIVDASVRLDRDALDAVLGELAATAPFLEIASEALVPALREIGARWERGELSIVSEHFASSVVRSRVTAMIQATAPSSGPLALVACAPGDQHELGALVTCYRIALDGWSVSFLGANLPIEEFAGAIASARPGLVGLSVVMPVDAGRLAAWLEALAAACPAGTRKTCGGAGALEHERLVVSLGFEPHTHFSPSRTLRR